MGVSWGVVQCILACMVFRRCCGPVDICTSPRSGTYGGTEDKGGHDAELHSKPILSKGSG